MIRPARKTILIVDNDPDVAEMTARTVYKLEYTIAAIVSTGEEAIEKASSLRPDLVIMDVVLDGVVDGIQAGRHIEDRYNIPSIYVTGYPDKAVELEGRGKVPLVKPFTLENLKTAIGVIFYKIKKNEGRRDNTLEDMARPLLNKTLVIVDDNMDFAEPLAELLKGLGINTQAIVSNAAAAFLKCRELNPDFVIMDVLLEGEIDGIKAGRYLRDQQRIPIIYVTCHHGKAELLEEAGEVPLRKPFQTKNLIAAIGAALYKSP
jgi:1,2-diacylglycerol 3-beta-glucosyltransferase